MNLERNTIDALSGAAEGLAPWQAVASGHETLDQDHPGTLLGRSVQVRVARSGHGRTADALSLTLASASAGVVLLAHTSGSDEEYVRGMGLQHPSNRRLARNVRVKDVGSSPAKLAKLLYKGISTSVRRGGPVPRLLVLDQGDHLSFGDGDAGAALDLLDAVAALDLDRVYELTGVEYEEWADAAAPDLTGLSMAVVVYVSPEEDATWGSPETLPSLEDVPAAWRAATSVIALERLGETEARLVLLKRPFLSAKKPPVVVPATFGADAGRPRWGVSTEHLHSTK